MMSGQLNAVTFRSKEQGQEA
jgi:hypothetical protein